MNPLFLPIAIALAVSAVITLLVTPPVRRLALALQIVDEPGRRKVHREPIPRLGGLAVAGAWIVGVLVSLRVLGISPIPARLIPVIGIGAIVVLIGVWDDSMDLPGRVKLAAQVAIASLVFWVGIKIDRISNPFGGYLPFPLPLSYLVTVLWVIGMMNAVNLIDGLDGLACGIAAISASGLIVAGVHAGSQTSAIALAALAGACVGFLRYNFYPATIFLGDSGSQFLGFVFAATALLGNQDKSATAAALLIPLTVLSLPIFDTALAFVRRLRHRRSIFRADKDHLHHRLLRLGLSHRQVVLFFYLTSAYLSLLAFLFVVIREQYALVLLVLLALGLVMAMQTLRFLEYKLLRLARTRAHLRTAA